MVICPKCGKEVNEEVNYCPYCGARLKVNIETIKLKVEEYRHQEKMSWGTVGLGLVVILIAFIIGSVTATRYEWHGSTLYEITYHPHANAAIVLGVVGIIIVILGVIIGAYYSYQRTKLMKELEAR